MESPPRNSDCSQTRLLIVWKSSLSPRGEVDVVEEQIVSEVETKADRLISAKRRKKLLAGPRRVLRHRRLEFRIGLFRRQYA